MGAKSPELNSVWITERSEYQTKEFKLVWVEGGVGFSEQRWLGADEIRKINLAAECIRTGVRKESI